MSTSVRPGVYSSYEVTSSVTGSAGAGVVGLVAAAASGTPNEITTVRTYDEAVSAFGSGSSMTELARLILLNGASAVYAVPTAGSTTQNYAAAFAVLAQDEDVKALVCDSSDADVLAAMADTIEEAGEKYKYRIAVAEKRGSAAAVAALAGNLNYERVVLIASPDGDIVTGSCAAAFAGLIAGAEDPAIPFNGAQLRGISGAAPDFTENEITTLINSGVTPLEQIGGALCVVRAVTTRTTTNSVADATWREVNTVLIIDDVIPSLKNALRLRFSRSKNTAQTRGAIRSQVVIELESKLRREIIDDYGDITVTVSEDDPTVCVVSFAFTVTHGLNQIHLTAHITV